MSDADRATPDAISEEELFTRLTSARARVPGRARIAFDGDGTLWGGDVGDELFERMVGDRGIRACALEALRRERDEHVDVASASTAGTDINASEANALAAALWEAYRNGHYAEDRCFAMMAWALTGHTVDEAFDWGRRVLADEPIERRVLGVWSSLVAWAEEHDVELWVVSASARAIVEPAAVALGVPAERVIAMTPAVGDDGRILPRIEGRTVYGPGKAEALAEQGSDRRLLGMFGDSGWDADAMEVAMVAVGIGNKESLRQRVRGLEHFVYLAPEAAAHRPLSTIGWG